MMGKLKDAHATYLEDELEYHNLDSMLQSYLGILSHSNQFQLTQAIKNSFWSRSPAPRIVQGQSAEARGLKSRCGMRAQTFSPPISRLKGSFTGLKVCARIPHRDFSPRASAALPPERCAAFPHLNSLGLLATKSQKTKSKYLRPKDQGPRT